MNAKIHCTQGMLLHNILYVDFSFRFEIASGEFSQCGKSRRNRFLIVDDGKLMNQIRVTMKLQD
jgi:hypothetical protein